MIFSNVHLNGTTLVFHPSELLNRFERVFFFFFFFFTNLYSLRRKGAHFKVCTRCPVSEKQRHFSRVHIATWIY